MLKTRIITALALFSVFVSALFFLPVVFWAALATLVAAVAAWEWGGLQAYGAKGRVSLAVVTAFFCCALVLLFPGALGMGPSANTEELWALGRWFYLPAAAFWLVVVPVWMRRRWSLPKNLLGLMVGAILILPTWLSLIQLRQLGAWALVALVAVVWVADTGAYFCGRRFGRRKLAPTISPGKTWEGALGGAILVVTYGVLAARAFDLPLAANLPVLLVLMLMFAALSVIGDLFESLLKRQAGLKDSSAILPGHGGVLDRIDSLTSTLPLVAAFWLLTAS